MNKNTNKIILAMGIAYGIRDKRGFGGMEIN
jgi:hypothetical protein